VDVVRRPGAAAAAAAVALPVLLRHNAKLRSVGKIVEKPVVHK
jgi:hypothetical protein